MVGGVGVRGGERGGASRLSYRIRITWNHIARCLGGGRRLLLARTPRLDVIHPSGVILYVGVNGLVMAVLEGVGVRGVEDGGTVAFISYWNHIESHSSLSRRWQDCAGSPLARAR